jgi:GT2 family glycosyltransferase
MTGPRISVIICAYTELRWQLLARAVESVRRQSAPAVELIMVIDQNEALFARAKHHLAPDRILENRGPRGLSGARNTGLAVARGDTVAFLDDDAEADPHWLAALGSAYTDKHVVGVGGLVVPVWAAGERPGWLPTEFDWVVGCSYTGLPTQRSTVRNPIGANMSFRTAPLREVGGFSSEVGRIGTRPLGCEETEVAIRLARRHPEARVLFEPAAVVHHHVPAKRGKWAYFRARCWSEGLSKAMVARLSDPRQALSAERRYVSRVLPRAVLDGLGEAVIRARPVAAARAVVVVAGLMLTTAGYAAGRLRSPQPASTPTPSTDTTRQRSGDLMTHVTTRSDRDRSWLNFDIHGIAGIRVHSDAPTARQLNTMLACFATEQEVPGDITVTPVHEPMPEAGWLELDFAYTDRAALFPDDRVQIVRDPEGWHIHGSGELLTALVPVLDRCMVERDAAMIHAATVSYRGHGIALPAAGGTGKTSTIAKLMKRPEYGFMGDDWAFISGDGRMLGFEKPMFIKPHHRPIYPHLFSGARKPLVPKALSRPVGKLTTVVHPVIVRYPHLADISRRWSPEHRMVAPRKALPGGNFTRTAPLAAAIYVERYDGAVTRLVERDHAWMVDRMIGNFHIEMPGFSQHVVAAMGASNLVPTPRHYREKAAVLSRALDGLPCMVLRVPRVYSADTASDDIVAVMSDLLPTLVRTDTAVPEEAIR